MAFDGSLNFDTKINTKGFNKDVGTLSKSVKKLGALIAVTFGVRALVKFGKEAVQVASDLEEVQNVVDVAFGSMAEDINEFAETAIEKFGLSELSAKRYASSLGAMGSSMGFAAKQNADMSKELTGLVGDFASFYNIRQDMAATALSSIYTGETETLKRYGILITEVNLQEFARQQGITKSIQKMTQQEKVMLRYNFVLKATENSQGDFLRTQESWANQTRILSQRWEQFLGLIGKNLVQVFAPAVKMLNNLLVVLIAATEQFNAFYSAVSGAQVEQQSKVTSSIGDSVDQQDDLTDAVKATNKEVGKSLAGFDDINVLQEKSASLASSEPLAMASVISTEVSQPEEQAISPVFKNLLELLKPLQEINLGPLNWSLVMLERAVEPLKQNLFEGIKWFYLNVLVPLSLFTIQDVVPSFLDLLAASLGVLSSVVEVLKPLGLWLWDEFLKPLAEWTGAKIIEDIEKLTISLEKFSEWIYNNQETVEGIVTTVLAFASAMALVNIAVGIWAIVAAIAAGATGAFAAALAILTSPITLAILVITFLILLIVRLIKNWDKVKEVAGVVADFIIDKWGKFATFMKEKVVDPVIAVFKLIGSAIKGPLLAVFDLVTASLKMAVNGWITMAEGFFNFFIKGINALISGLNRIQIDVPDWVPKIGGKSFGVNIPKISSVKLPRLATGAVIPPNAEFAAVLGDQRSGTNIETPEALMRQIFREEGSGSGEIVIKVEGNMAELVRIMKPELDEESKRRGQKMRVVPV